MANPEHLSILKQGVEIWNEWREDNLHIRADLHKANLRGLDLGGANLKKAFLRKANLREANLSKANLSRAYLNGANLHKSNLSEANLSAASLGDAILADANLSKANLREANLSGVNLVRANLSAACLIETYLGDAILSEAILNQADLSGAILSSSILIETDFTQAILYGCDIFGISAWKLKLEGAIQSDLIITNFDEPKITVDNIEVAQFIYLLLNNQKLRDVIDTITTKAVLILGRFTDKRKAVLDAIREELRHQNYIPIMFDFEKPQNRNFTETVRTLVGLSRFVIVDLSDPNSAPHEVASFAEQFRSVPLQAIFCPTEDHPNPYPMYNDFSDLSHVLPIYRYDTQQQLIDNLREKVIEPAEAKVQAMKPK